MTPLSDAARTICARHWRHSNTPGTVHPGCCKNCPLGAVCGSAVTPLTHDAHTAWVEAVNALADAMLAP